MILYEKEINLPKKSLVELCNEVERQLLPGEQPVRFVITSSDATHYKCELGILKSSHKLESIFDFRKRKFENTDQFNAVLLVPTGVGAEIGGHSGDAGPVARLIASACDNLITHPNVVNGSDINEMPENTLYVEGSVISRMIMGTVGLQKVRSNRILLVIDKHQDKFFHDSAINSLSAARAAFGLNSTEVLMVEDNVLMRAFYSENSGRAVGRVERLENLIKAIGGYGKDFDAVALSSIINVPMNYHMDYFKDDEMLNPWGGVEAMLTHAVSSILNIPSAHSPMCESRTVSDIEAGRVDPRKAAEAVSLTYLHCILKGLHKSPKIITETEILNNSGILSSKDVSCLLIPDGCVGLPTIAALEQGIPVIAVKENKNRMKNDLRSLPFAYDKLFIVENYLEAAGVMQALKAGVSLDTVRRPLKFTKVTEAQSDNEDLKVKNNSVKPA